MSSTFNNQKASFIFLNGAIKILNITIVRVSLLLTSFLLFENSNSNEKYKEKSLKSTLKSCYFYQVISSKNPVFIFHEIESLIIKDYVLENVISSNILEKINLKKIYFIIDCFFKINALSVDVNFFTSRDCDINDTFIIEKSQIINLFFLKFISSGLGLQSHENSLLVSPNSINIHNFLKIKIFGLHVSNSLGKFKPIGIVIYNDYEIDNNSVNIIFFNYYINPNYF